MNKIKLFFTELMAKIASENSKNFGSRRIDCCNVNKKK